MKKILVIGSINMDLVIQVDRMPVMGETLRGYGAATNAGGKGANQAAAMAKLGASVRMLGAVGRDEYGRKMRSILSACGVQCDSVVDADQPTGLALITVCHGDNCIVIDPGANASISPELIDQNMALFHQADIVVLQLEIPMETVIHAAQVARKAHAHVILNPAPVDSPLPDELLGNIDLLIPNEHEASALLGGEVVTVDNALSAAQELRRKYRCNTLITLGSKGCVYCGETASFYQPAATVSAVDTTAAGDSFIGGLCYAAAAGMSVKEAVRYATAVSSVTVTRHGAIPSLPTGKEADAAYRALSDTHETQV